VGAGFLTQTASAAGTLDRSNWRPMYNTLPGEMPSEAIRGSLARTRSPETFVAPPLWQPPSFKDPLDGKTYNNLLFVGSDPKLAKTTDVPVYLLSFKITFLANDKGGAGVTLDASKPSCGENASVLARVENSPLFAKAPFVSNGVSEGTTQYMDALQRAMWTGRTNSASHLLLTPASSPNVYAVAVTIPKADGYSQLITSTCSVGIVKQSYMDAVLRSVLTHLNRPATQVAFALYNNVYQTDNSGGCCIIGYHSYQTNSSVSYVRLFGVGAYVMPHIFVNQNTQKDLIDDVAALTHEMGELINDPDGGNPTPAWGHLGQVPGCQNNLEVGDPLSGTMFTSTLNSFVYHLQDLVFFSWFYRGTPSNHLYFGTGGRYSFKGTLTSSSLKGVCH
jgi:hypothetical protein